MNLTPTVLEGRHVRLEPLSLAHAEDLARHAFDQELWRHTTSVIRNRGELDGYIATALEWQAANTALPFATIDRASGRAVGSTRLANADHANRRVEIGWTWLGQPFQRTALNTEAKLLMLEHAFDRLDCIRVELKTSALNVKSRTAIGRLGAVEEGTFRHHLILPDGRLRDTVFFSILRGEWPGVRATLEAKLASHA